MLARLRPSILSALWLPHPYPDKWPPWNETAPPLGLQFRDSSATGDSTSVSDLKGELW